MSDNGVLTLPRIAPDLAALPHVPVDALQPLQGNLKELTAREYNKLKKSILEFGLIVPFFVWKETGKLLDGHQRQRVFIKENWLLNVPVVYISAVTEEEAKKMLLVISSQYGRVTQDGWDEFVWDVNDEWLQETVQFDALPFVFGEWGGAEPEESRDAEPQTSRAEELQDIWQVETGQVWRLPSRTPGQEHRLICGDCTDAGVVDRLEPPFDMMFTDPPYGVDYSGGIQFQKNGTVQKENRERLTGDTVDMYARFLPIVLPLIDGPCYAWFADRGGKPVYDAILANGGEIHAMLIWHKTNATYAAMNAQYKQRHEPFMYFKRKGQTLRWCGATTEPTVWEIPRDPINDLHPTQKPIALAQRAIGNHDVMTVADFFCGSGSTIIAAENLSRQCRAIEISPAYCAVILQRYRDAFGIEPELIA